MKSICLSFLLLLLLGTVSFADGDLVYSARYYLPPGSKGTSHFHLYRINPDGTGKRQITFGKYNDDNPQWSPDGKQVLFTRATPGADRQYVCLISARGGPVTRLLNITKYSWPQCAWSPDNQEIAVSDSESPLVDILDLKTHKQNHLRGCDNFCWSPDGKWYYLDDGAPHFASRQLHVSQRSRDSFIGDTKELQIQTAVWAGNQAVVGIDSKSESKQVYLAALSVNGAKKQRVLCRWPNIFKSPLSEYYPENDPYIDSINAGARSLLPWPRNNRDIVYVQDVGTSGTSPDYDYWRADTITGKMTKITDGQFLAWAPDGQRFCTSPAHGGMDYGKTGKSLYVASLEIGSVKTDKLKEIVTGLVWVTGADWRRHK